MPPPGTSRRGHATDSDGSNGGDDMRRCRNDIRRQYGPAVTMPFLLLLVASLLAPALAMRADKVAELRRETVDMFYHGFDGYMQIAFPEDELRPVSCIPLTRDDKNPHNIGINDVLGNYSLTLIDSLSTLAILASAPPEDGDAGPKALRDFQNGVASLVQLYGDGTPGPSGQGQRGRGFDQDSKVQVFETVIRGVGGLLSAHLFAVGDLPIAGYEYDAESGGKDYNLWPNGLRYDGQLLRLALDLATRLLPAFYSPTGMPYPRVNLRYGIPFYTNSPLHGPNLADESSSSGGSQTEVTETCSAGAGSLVLEFTVLSRLTGDQRFEQLAKRAFWAVWYRRSDIGLIGAGVDAEQGRWIGGHSVIGAGADSFFEYALKSHILLSGHELPNRTYQHEQQQQQQPPAPGVVNSSPDWLDPNAMFPRLSDEENAPDSFLLAWHLAHAAIKRHLYSDREHPHYVNVNIWTGSLASQWIDSLGAYYSGLLILAGELEEAIETNLLYTAVWTKYAALPERWSLRDRTVEGGLGWWPLRPEFIESTYHIYRATHDPWYLYVGEMVLRDIQRRCWTRCGWAGLQNVLDGEKSDRMESFFLGETAKYMYLLFDDKHPLNSLDAAYVFTTEGHPLIIPTESHRKKTKLPKRTGKANKAGNNKKATKKQQQQQQKEAEEAAAASSLRASGHTEPANQEVGLYDDNGFARTCPVPPEPAPLTGSAVTSRADIFHASKMLDLHVTPDSKPVRARAAGGKYANPRKSSVGYTPPRLSNHTLYPWTLPPSMLPEDGISAKVQQPLEMSLEFSLQDGAGTGGTGVGGVGISPFNVVLGSGAQPTLSRAATNKIRVNTISGLKLIFRLEDQREERTWRVTRINGVPMGRDEEIMIDRSLLGHISDMRFNLVRDPIVVKLHHMHKVVLVDEEELANMDKEEEQMKEEATPADASTSTAAAAGQDSIESPGSNSAEEATSSTGIGILVKSLWQQIVASLDGLPLPTESPTTSQDGRRGNKKNKDKKDKKGQAPLNLVINATGVTPTGPGAAPLPAVDTPPGASVPAKGRVSTRILPWTKVYDGGYGCDEPFPDTAARDYQVLVLRRGGCSFSQKLANVPPFPPGRSQSLQLVVIVSDDDDVRAGGPGPTTFHDGANDFVRPLLEDTQQTPGGMARRQPLAMIMVGGGEAAYEQIASAVQLGLTRRYTVESQGIRIRNILLDDGDEP